MAQTISSITTDDVATTLSRGAIAAAAPAQPPEANCTLAEAVQGTSFADHALAVNDREAASLMGISRAHWHVLVRDGRAPAPVKMARSSRWRRLELIAWLNAGCPPRHRWKWKPGEAAKP